MDFASFVKNASRDTYDVCDRAALQRLGRAMDRAEHGLKTLLANNDTALESFEINTLARLADVYREYSRWKDAAKQLRRALAQSGLSLPDSSLSLAITPDEIAALERTASVCQRSGHTDHDKWASAVKEHVELWRACVKESLANGTVSVKLAAPDHPDAEEFEQHVSTRTGLSEIRGYNWLAIRRGERAGILEVELDLPWSDIQPQVEARLPVLGLVAQKRGAESLLKELVAGDLLQTVVDSMTQRAEKEALESARLAYLGLLTTPPLQANKVVAMYIGGPGKDAGVAFLDRRGDIVECLQIPADDAFGESVKGLIEKHEPEAAVLPITSPDPKRLESAEDAVGSLPVQRVNDIALSEASGNLSMKPFEAAAVVIGRRALKPGREWSRVDPMSLGLGEYQREVDMDQMRLVLDEAKALSSWERRIKNRAPRKVKSPPRPAATLSSVRKLNKFIKTIRDLRPGMTVDGIITNITRFGAFVNIGLPTEGMIHVSQLSVEFVENPAQVVRVGEQIKARVLEVVPEKQRIALSLKPAQEEKGSSVSSERKNDGKSGRGAPKSRSAALADLDALFKK